MVPEFGSDRHPLVSYYGHQAVGIFSWTPWVHCFYSSPFLITIHYFFSLRGFYAKIFFLEASLAIGCFIARNFRILAVGYLIHAFLIFPSFKLFCITIGCRVIWWLFFRHKLAPFCIDMNTVNSEI